MNDNKPVVNNTVGPGFLSLLTLLFITLKLTGYINWSWWLVLSPLLFVIAIIVLFIVLAIIYAK